MSLMPMINNYKPEPAGPPDTTPPVISAIDVYSVTSNSAIVIWITDELADSKVVYGNSDYGSNPASWPNSAYDGTDVTYHSVPLSGLSPFTIYYFRVVSKDPSENEAISGAYIFRTTR